MVGFRNEYTILSFSIFVGGEYYISFDSVLIKLWDWFTGDILLGLRPVLGGIAVPGDLGGSGFGKFGDRLAGNIGDPWLVLLTGDGCTTGFGSAFGSRFLKDSNGSSFDWAFFKFVDWSTVDGLARPFAVVGEQISGDVIWN